MILDFSSKQKSITSLETILPEYRFSGEGLYENINRAIISLATSSVSEIECLERKMEFLHNKFYSTGLSLKSIHAIDKDFLYENRVKLLSYINPNFYKEVGIFKNDKEKEKVKKLFIHLISRVIVTSIANKLYNKFRNSNGLCSLHILINEKRFREDRGETLNDSFIYKNLEKRDDFNHFFKTSFRLNQDFNIPNYFEESLDNQIFLMDTFYYLKENINLKISKAEKKKWSILRPEDLNISGDFIKKIINKEDDSSFDYDELASLINEFYIHMNYGFCWQPLLEVVINIL